MDYAVVASLCAAYRPTTIMTPHLSIVPKGKEGMRNKGRNSLHVLQRVSLYLPAKVPTNQNHGNSIMTDKRTNKPMRMQVMNVHITYIHSSLIYPVSSPASCRQITQFTIVFLPAQQYYDRSVCQRPRTDKGREKVIKGKRPPGPQPIKTKATLDAPSP